MMGSNNTQRDDDDGGFRLTTTTHGEKKSAFENAVERTRRAVRREVKTTQNGWRMSVGLPLASVTFARAKANEQFQLCAAAAAAKKKTTTTNEKPVKIPLARMLKSNREGIVVNALGKTVAVFLAGGIAGALAKTCTAPLDRLKIIMQTSGASQQSAAAKAAVSGGLIPAFLAIGKTEGLAGYWRGNTPQVARVLPYSATMLFAYDFYKKKYADKSTGELSVQGRLLAGASACMYGDDCDVPVRYHSITFKH